MVRRYEKRLQLAKLNETIEKQKRRSLRIDSEDEDEDVDKDTETDTDADEEESTQNDKQGFMPPRYILEQTPHFTHPNINQGLCQHYDPDRPMSTFPNCALTVPLPLYVSSGTTSIVEPCYKRPNAHEDWYRRLLIYKKRYLDATARQKQRELKHKHLIYNAHIFDAAEEIATQDNAFFRDSYDYYYTGGNLNLLQYAAAGDTAKTLAMHVAGERLQQLHLSEVIAEAEVWSPLHSESLNGMSSEIFELMPINSFRVNHGNMFLARLLNEIVIYELKLKKEMDIEEVDNEEEVTAAASKYELCCQSKYSSQNGPFISVAQATNRPQILAFACQDHTVRFKDIVTQQDVAKHKVCILKGIHKTSTWAQLLASEEHCFHYLCQSALLTIDMRCSNEAKNPCFASSAYTKECESFSCLGRSQNPHHLYVASNHKLHCLDIRCMGKKIADRSVVTWTHQMSYPPIFMDAIVHEGIEYVALGGANPSDQRICELKGALAESWTEMSSPALPFGPTQLKEALADGRLQGLADDIYADLNERIKCCTTGLKFDRLNNASDGAFAQLLTANSIGDIYCQRMTQRDEVEMKEELRTGQHTSEAIVYYADLVRQNTQRKLKCTQIQNISVLREIMQSEEERGVEQEEKPVVIKDVSIDYGFDDSDSEESMAGNQEDEEQLTPPDPPAKEQKAESPEKDKKSLKKLKAVGRGPWQKSAYQLNRYKDVISKCLLDIWDIDDYELTRDVHIDMIDEKLKKEKGEKHAEARTADWLQQLQVPTENAAAHAQDEDNQKHLVPGTNLPTHFEAQYADYRELNTESIDVDKTAVTKTEDTTLNGSLNFTRQPHSTLLAGEFTIVETDLELKPTPAKRRKTKYTMGF